MSPKGTSRVASQGAGDAGPTPPPLPPPRRSRTSLRPALFIVGLAVVILVVFGIGAALTSPTGGPHGVPASSGGAVHSGSVTMTVTPAKSMLEPILTPGEPPPNIVAALTVPGGTRRVGYQRNLNSTQQYDRTVHLAWHGSQTAVIDFYRARLPRSGWKIESDGPASSGSGLQLLAQKGGSDGWYWEVAVIVSPTEFAKGGVHAPAGSESTPFSLELMQVSTF